MLTGAQCNTLLDREVDNVYTCMAAKICHLHPRMAFHLNYIVLQNGRVGGVRIT